MEVRDGERVFTFDPLEEGDDKVFTLLGQKLISGSRIWCFHTRQRRGVLLSSSFLLSVRTVHVKYPEHLQVQLLSSLELPPSSVDPS